MHTTFKRCAVVSKTGEIESWIEIPSLTLISFKNITSIQTIHVLANTVS